MNKNRALIIFIFFAILYSFTAKGNIEVSDTSFSIQTARSIVENHSLAVKECVGGYCYRTPDGRCYSKFGIGLPFLFIPYILLGKIIAFFTGMAEYPLTNTLISFYNIFFGAGTCVLIYRIAKFFKNTDRASLIMALVFGLGTMCWRYSIWDFSDATQMFFLTLAAYCVLKNTLRDTLTGSLAYVFLILLKAVHILYLPGFLIYIFAVNRRDKKDVLIKEFLFLSVIFMGLVSIFALNYMRFGSIVEFGYGAEASLFYLSGLRINIIKLLFSPDKGIFIYNPLLLLAVFGYIKFFKLFRKEALLFVSIISLNLVVTSMWYGWFGGWSWGPRFLVPALPLWFIPSSTFFQKRGIFRAVLIIFISISLLIQVLSVLTGGFEYQRICSANANEGLQKGMPPQLIGSAILLKHKILKKDNLYRLSEFGIISDTIVDTSKAEK